MLLFLFLLLFCEFDVTCGRKKLGADDERRTMAYILSNLTEELLREQNDKIHSVDYVRMDHYETPAYEIGYMIQIIQEHYRRMLDKWQIVREDISKYYTLEVALYLEEIEHLYWAIKHEVYMLHEVERKYEIPDPKKPDKEVGRSGPPAYLNPNLVTRPSYTPHPYKETKPKAPPQKFNQKKLMENIMKEHGKSLLDPNDPKAFERMIENMHTTSKKPSRLERDYGWDIYEWNSDT